MAGTVVSMLAPGLCRAQTQLVLLRMALSIDTLGEINIDDARAAYMALINEYNSGHGGRVSAEVVPGVFVPSGELLRDFRQDTIQCFGATALEYAKLLEFVDPEFLVLQDYLADGMEYVLLVHSSSSFETIASLRDAQILTHLHRDMALLPAWLGTLLAANNLPQPERFFGAMTSSAKINQVVLPVFFRRAGGACLARRSWETAVELNPQLGRDLRVLAVSPRIIPIAIGFRRNCNAMGRKLLLDSMLNVTSTASGRQMAALYQANRFLQRPASVMKGTLEMIRQYERVSAQMAGPRNGKP
jgi:hypothetical protein